MAWLGLLFDLTDEKLNLIINNYCDIINRLNAEIIKR